MQKLANHKCCNCERLKCIPDILPSKTVLTRIISIVHVIPSFSNEGNSLNHDDDRKRPLLSVKECEAQPSRLMIVPCCTCVTRREGTHSEWLFSNGE